MRNKPFITKLCKLKKEYISHLYVNFSKKKIIRAKKQLKNILNIYYFKTTTIKHICGTYSGVSPLLFCKFGLQSLVISRYSVSEQPDRDAQ